jgi:hypothetical protein
MPLQATSGAASYDAFGGGVPVVPAYIEEVFSTYLYTGNTNTQTITNGIDLSGKGGLTWIKQRNGEAYHSLFDTVRGAGNPLFSNTTNAQDTDGAFTAFTSTGFSLGTYFGGGGYVNTSGSTYASWTFRKQPKFFDVLTYTGNASSRTIAHNLGSVPGCIIVKCTSNADNWYVYHTSLGATQNVRLNQTNAAATNNFFWDSTAPTSTVFSVGASGNTNQNGYTYVAYLFAHDAGGFGLTGTDNVISCGSYTGNGTAGNAVTLGYEPQFVMIKRTDSTGNWFMQDIMRGIPNSGSSFYLYANTSDAETDGGVPTVIPTATGFTLPSFAGWNASGGTFIYIAIRRGPMKVPTVGTSVFSPNRFTSATDSTITTNFPVDMQISKWMGGTDSNAVTDRLRGLNSVAVNANQPILTTNSTGAEANNGSMNYGFNNTRFLVGENYGGNGWTVNFRRAPSFFDVVCYTGTGTYGATNHNLGVTPELVIYKSRSNAVNWGVIKPVSSIAYYDGLLNSNSAFTYYSNDPSVAGLYTSTQFAKYQDTSSYTYVAYLFATCAGVSKVGSYTGNGSSQTINCGFTAGARFVLIKRTDSTGDWYVWDTARGIVSGNDPYLLLNSSAAEVTNTDYIDTYSAGFEISSSAPSAINASGGTFIFLAIA